MIFDVLPAHLTNSPSDALAVLTSMITPALLLSACGTFILSTSQRLGRVIDRIRILSEQMEKLMQQDTRIEMLHQRRTAIFHSIDSQSVRAKLLARALMIFYISSGAFVATSVAIGLIAVLDTSNTWIPLGLGISGACLLFAGSLVLILEARLAVRALREETDFLGRLVDHQYRQPIDAG